MKIFVTRAGEKLSEDVAKIVGIEAGTKSAVNIVAFLIEGGVIKPDELRQAEEEARRLAERLDTSRPVIISGRGPHWLYAVFTHNLHFFPIVATWEPRKKVGIIVEAPTAEVLGMGITVDGKIVDVEMGAKGVPVVRVADVGKKSILHFEVKGDRFLEPKAMREIEYPEVPTDKPLVIEGPMPIWMGQRLVAQYVHKVPALAVYDPRLKSGVVVAVHAEGYTVGELLQVTSEEIEKAVSARKTRVIGILGDPNSGKSVFLHLLNDVLRSKGYVTLTQEADITAPTQHWSLYSPEVRKELKKHMTPEERLKWIVESLKSVKESGAVDFVLADIGGGRPDLGQRITRENLAILQYVDGVVIVSRNESGQIGEWIRELRMYKPDIKVYGIVESKLTGMPFVSRDGYGVAVYLDRTAYRENKIPEGTKKVAETIAERIVSDEHVKAIQLEPRTVLEKLRQKQQSALQEA